MDSEAKAGVLVRGSSGWTHRIGIALTLVLLVLAASRAEPAAAHSVLVRSDPAANAKLPQSPRVVSIYFSEPLEAKFSKARVVDTNGSQHDEGDSRVDAADSTHLTLDVKSLQPGFYSVLWTTVSKVDGHKLDGSYPFIILNPDGSLPVGAPAQSNAGVSAAGTGSTGPADVAAYWIAILSAVALFGAGVFTLIIAIPAAHVLDRDAEDGRRAIVALITRLLRYVLLAFFVGALAELLLQLRLVGGIASLGEFLTTAFGGYWFIRVLLGLLAAGCLIGLARVSDPSSRAPVLSLMTLCALGILLTFSLTSHGGAVGNGSFWAVIADGLHLTAVGIWVGGLLSLTLLFWRWPASLPRARRVQFRSSLVSRFSPMAAAAVTIILLTGAFNAIVEIPTWAGLFHTEYGHSLLIKLALVVVLLVVAGVNAFILRPRLEESASGRGSDALKIAERLERRLSRTVAAEAGVGAAVLLAVGLLLIAPPARDLATQAAQASAPATGSSVYNNTATATDLNIQLTVDPNKVGLNTYRIRLTDAAGPVSDATLVRLDFSFADPKFGTSNLVLPSAANGIYEASGANFAQVGRWQLTAVVRRTGKDDALTSFGVEVPDAAGNLTINRVNQVDPFASPSHLFSTDQLGGMALVLFGLLPLVLRRQLWGIGPVAGAIGTFCGVSGLILGGTLFFAAHQEGTVDYTLLANPVPVSNDSVAAGKSLYMQNCAVCHGDTGHGDGPAARALNPQPFDLTVHVGLHADGVLWGWITDGIPRTAMLAWKDKLTDTQRWQLVDFLRTDFQTTASAPPAAPGTPPELAAASAWALALDAAPNSDTDTGRTHANP
ncbi:MAG TPA: CopD family protein, partial [Dehalococcoidia bacterium]|nr:CopD family protein [Dehalococcoidia bacterium]